MTNSYYNYSGAFIPGTLGRAESCSTEFSAVAAGFALLSSIGTDSGAANAYAVTVTGGGPTSYTDGLPINFKPANANTAASTINVNGIGAVPLLRSNGTPVQSGDIVAGTWYEVQYNTLYTGFCILAPTLITAFSGTISGGAPTYKVGLTAAGGVSTSACPIDATFAIDQNISPTWTGTHTFNGTIGGTALAGLFAAPGAIGGTTPSTGKFTTLTVTTSISGTAFTTFFASPPAIGSTVPAAGAFTTLSATSTVSGAGITALFASPPAIGGTAAAAGTFTTMTAATAVVTGTAGNALSVTGVAAQYAVSVTGNASASHGLIISAGVAAATDVMINARNKATTVQGLLVYADGHGQLGYNGAAAVFSWTAAGALTVQDTAGTQWGAPTGGAKGSGTINAAGLYVNGVAAATSTSGSVTLSATGFTTVPTGTAYYAVSGNVCTVFLPTISATSNASTFTLTGLPVAARPARTQQCQAMLVGAVDNSGTVGATAFVDTAGTVTLFKVLTIAGGAVVWTGSGSKGLTNSTISYLLN